MSMTKRRARSQYGLAPGTRLADIPDDWYCPGCGVTKLDFEPLEF